MYWSAPEILTFIAYAYSCQSLNKHGELSSVARLQKIGLSLRLSHLFVCASSEGFDEPAHLRRLILAFAAPLCNMNQHPMNSKNRFFQFSLLDGAQIKIQGCKHTVCYRDRDEKCVCSCRHLQIPQ